MPSETILKTDDLEGRSVSLNSRQWEHILLKRPWMREHLAKIGETVEEPQTLLGGVGGELIAVRRFRALLHGASLVVVYRIRGDKGFIITAFPTTKAERLERRRKVIWRQKR